jgi:hypothetical protein
MIGVSHENIRLLVCLNCHCVRYKGNVVVLMRYIYLQGICNKDFAHCLLARFVRYFVHVIQSVSK